MPIEALKMLNTILFSIFFLSNSVYSNPLFTCSFPFLILHSNDINSRYNPIGQNTGRCVRGQKCYGGFARISHVVKKERSQDVPVLYLIAGNTFTRAGNPKMAADFLNKLAPNATAFGDNELDRGVGTLFPYVERLQVPIICSNINTTNVPFLDKKVKKSLVLEIHDIKIGIVGFVSEKTRNIYIDNLIFEDEITALQRETKILENNGVRIIIALGHSGFKKDKEIAAKLPLIDIVIGGEAHSLLWNGKVPDIEKRDGPYPTVIRQKSGRSVPVVHVYGYTKYIGKMLVNFSTAGVLMNYEGNPLLLSHSITEDPEILAMGSGEKISVTNVYIIVHLIIFLMK